MVLLTKDTIYCANAGDCRAIIANNDGSVVELSNDHKPENEKERIEKAGGNINDNRVNGIIAVSRAIGDW